MHPKDPDYESAVRTSFARQGAMGLLGATIHRVAPGLVEVALPWRDALGQQDGFFHAGVQTAVVDSAGGYAARTLMPQRSRVLTVEYKLNFVAPAKGDRLLARGEVLRAGATLTVCRLTVQTFDGTRSTETAVGQQTIMRLPEDRA